MIKWLFKNPEKKSYPDYWIRYEALFSAPKNTEIHNTTFVVLDTETTGFNYASDRMLCIGALKINDNNIDIKDVFEIYIKQEYFNAETVPIHGIIKNEKFKTYTEEEALILFLDYIKDAVLVAHHAFFDITMINEGLKRLDLPPLKNKVLDTMHVYKETRIKSNLIDQKKRYTLDEIAENYDIDVSDRHTAAGDALITAIIFLRSVQHLIKTKHYTLKKLFKL